MKQKKIVVIGATSAIAEHCARLWSLSESIEFVLVGRNSQKLGAVSDDLRVRNQGNTTQTIVADFSDVKQIKQLADAVCDTRSPDLVLIAHGTLPDQERCQNSLAACREALEINGLSVALFSEAFAQHMEKQNGGTLVIIGSVAGDRGRKSNYVYGSAKGLVTRYAQGLQHRFAGSGVKVVLVKPGPTDTPMTSHLRSQGLSLSPVELVAKAIVRGVSRGKHVIYAPGKWALIMMVIRHLPTVIFNKLNI